jgi:putative glycosyltransferase
MKLSIVTTLYRSAPYVEEFCRRAAAAARALVGDDYEIVLVNDGSPDASLKIAVALRTTEPRLVIVDLSRNFGHHKAMMTGLAHARGDIVYLIDSDLEEEPEWLASFAEQMEREDCDVVYGVQKQRRGGAFERWSGQSFYRLFNAVTGLGLPENITVVRLMKRNYVDALLLHHEREVFLAGLWHITGFDQRPQPVIRQSTSETAYTLRHKLSMLVNAITSFSNKPLIYIFYIGMVISSIAGCYAAFLVVNWLFLARPPSGYTSVMVSSWLLGGLIICFIGVIGIYISKIFSETKHRPYTIIRRIYGRERDSGRDPI